MRTFFKHRLTISWIIAPPIALTAISLWLVITIALSVGIPLAQAERQAGSTAADPKPIILPPPPGFLFVVTSTGDGNNTAGGAVCDDGTGNCTLRAAIEVANNNAGDDTIRFDIPTTDPGFDSGTGVYTIALTSALPDLSTNINITGPGADNLTVSGSNGFRVFNVTSSGMVSFSGLTIFRGLAQDNGGGINNGPGTVNVTNCTLFGNGASFPNGAGGGINNSGGTVNITNSTLDGNGAPQGGGINNGSGTVIVTNCTLSGNSGGGIFNNGSVTVTNSTFSGNSATNSGGGIFNNNGTVNIGNCTLSNNSANSASGGSSDGGGIFNNNGTVNVSNCTLSNNSANSNSFSFGGGISNAATVNVTNSTLSGNSANSGGMIDGSEGGGIFNSTGTATITNSTLSGNSAFFGGGIGNQSGTATITNSTLSGNSANSVGGGIYGSAVNVTNSTLSGNSAISEGGGIFASGPVNIKSTIIALNTATLFGPDVNGGFTSSGFNLIGKTDGSTGFTAATDHTGTMAVPLDPKLDPAGLQNNGGPTQTVALLSGSPAINNGSPDAPPTDQRGYFRNGVADIGAYEFDGAVFAVTLANISTRALVGIGDEVMIGGFIIGGTGNKTVLLRAIGPSLSNPPFNLANTLQNPTLSLFGSGGMITSNDNWADASNAQSIDPSLRPTNSLESAILVSLAPGDYTAIVRGANGGTGIGLVEVFDLDTTVPSKLSNISTRGLVETGDSVMIGGFIIKGPDSDKVVVRAIGPSLSNFGLTNVLQNPSLFLFDGNGNMFAQNDDWRSTQEADIIATGLQPSNDAESAIVITLMPGNYTAIVRGVNGTTGVALVEVYGLN